MGQVILTRDLLAGERPLAIKLLLPEYRESTADFMREYAVQRRLDHPAIPRVYDFGFGQHAGREVPYFAMDYVRGIPLSNALAQLRQPALAYPWMLQVLRGVDHLHYAGFLHRDLKPSNILVTFDGGHESSAHLIDFGITVRMEDIPEELFIGTPEYSAPELMSGAPFDVRQDLYAIGLLLYEIHAGERPWPGEDPNDLYSKRIYQSYRPLDPKRCPPELAKLVDDLLEPAPEARPASAAEVIERFVAATRSAQDNLHRHAAQRPIETPNAFRRRLQTVMFEDAEGLDEAAASWLGQSEAPPSSVLLLEDPPGFDGAQIIHEVADRAAVGGSRVVRYALDPRPHGPLEAVQPVLSLLRRLREARGAPISNLGGLAGAATLLTRLPGPLVIALEGIGWADTLSLELLATVFTGARNPGLRVIATLDPTQNVVASRALERLKALRVTRLVARPALPVEAVTDWVDLVVGPDVVPDARILELWDSSEGRPQRVRELLTEDLRRGVLERVREGFRWNAERLRQLSRAGGDAGVRRQSQPILPTAAQSMDDLVSTLVEPVPEGVVSTFLGLPSADVRNMIADGVLERSPSGWVQCGPHGPPRRHRQALPPDLTADLHERLARAIELALPFETKAERAAREWLRSSDPLRAVPHLLEAAQRAALPRRGDVMPRAAALLDDARHILEAEDRRVRARAHERLDDGELGARLMTLRLDLGAARVRLARSLGDWPAWQRSGTELFERGLESGHVPTMEVALDALMHLAADRGAEEEMMRHARSLAELSPETVWALAWAEARIDLAMGRPGDAVAKLRGAMVDRAGRPIATERHLELAALEADILTSHGWLAEAEVAVRVQGELAQRRSDRAAAVHGALLGATLLRESQMPDKALAELRRLAAELGDDRFYRLDGRLEIELARAHIAFGWSATAREHLAQAIVLARRDGDRDTLLAARLLDARVVALAGHAREAMRIVDRAREDAGGLMRPSLRELEYTELEVALAGGREISPQRLFDAAQRLAVAVQSEGNRTLAVKTLGLAARAAQALGIAKEALLLADAALARSAEWGGVGVPRHQLLFLIARARHLKRDGFRARQLLGQAKAQLHQVARLLVDPAQRAALLEEPNNRKIQRGDLATVASVPQAG